MAMLVSWVRGKLNGGRDVTGVEAVFGVEAGRERGGIWGDKFSEEEGEGERSGLSGLKAGKVVG